ncbi:MAG: ASKHA domain-containing protein, partial [Clostridia bacterium]|nr:ASKHA domain-containing protein [Clostridia bacterium]
MKIHVLLYADGGSASLEAEAGITIRELFAQSQVGFDAPCGGNGRCGKCRLYAAGALSEPEERERSFLTEGELRSGMRLACYARLLGDCELRLPEENASIETSGRSEAYDFEPTVTVGEATLTIPTLKNPLDDRGNLLSAAKAADASYAALKKLPALTRAGKWSLFYVKDGETVLDVCPEKPKAAGMAVDIGTTTVVAYFYDLETGRLLGIESGLNEQKGFGADVISRIAACIDMPEGLRALQEAIIGQLNGFVQSFCRKSGFKRGNLYQATIAGNTTMQHIAAGLSPANIASAPFIPCSLFGFTLGAEQIGLELAQAAQVYFSPCLSSYVGGDITAGMLACGLDRMKDTCLYIDIGTNGEMALRHGGEIVCCSTAAGPAFEGAHIKYGTGGVWGAISGVRADTMRADAMRNGAVQIDFETIGGVPPIGLCGSGLIDALAVMKRLGVIDETGRIADPDELEDASFAPRLTEIDGEPAFVIDPESGICIT